MRTGLGGALDNLLELDLGIIVFIVFFFITFIIIIIVAVLFITLPSWSRQYEDVHWIEVGPSQGWRGCPQPWDQENDDDVDNAVEDDSGDDGDDGDGGDGPSLMVVMVVEVQPACTDTGSRWCTEEGEVQMCKHKDD